MIWFKQSEWTRVCELIISSDLVDMTDYLDLFIQKREDLLKSSSKNTKQHQNLKSLIFRQRFNSISWRIKTIWLKHIRITKQIRDQNLFHRLKLHYKQIELRTIEEDVSSQNIDLEYDISVMTRLKAAIEKVINVVRDLTEQYQNVGTSKPTIWILRKEREYLLQHLFITSHWVGDTSPDLFH